MIFNSINQALRPRIGHVALLAKHYSPELYLGGGLAMGIGAAVMLAKAHKDADSVLEIARGNVDERRDELESLGGEVPEDEARKIMAPLYGQLALAYIKQYGPPVLMGVGSVALILASHGVLRNRERTLVSLAALTERSFATYRNRVIEELGAEKDEQFLHGADVRTVTVIEETNDGKKKKKKLERNHIPEVYDPSVYTRIFDDTNPRWSPDRDRNIFFLQSIENLANAELALNGHVFLNYVYKQLGFKETAIGAVTGWTLALPGDGRVNFGLDDAINANMGDNRFALNFNTQGYILNGVSNRPDPAAS